MPPSRLLPPQPRPSRLTRPQIDGQERFAKLVDFLRKKLGRDQVVRLPARRQQLPPPLPASSASRTPAAAFARRRLPPTLYRPLRTAPAPAVYVPQGGLLSQPRGAHRHPARRVCRGRPPRGQLRPHPRLGLNRNWGCTFSRSRVLARGCRTCVPHRGQRRRSNPAPRPPAERRGLPARLPARGRSALRSSSPASEPGGLHAQRSRQAARPAAARSQAAPP